jgi:hypothetical protein
MIIHLVTAAHRYTDQAIIASKKIDFRAVSYQWALWVPRLKRATYIFGDTDRLSSWDLERAAYLYCELAATGCRVLNDPARVRQRFDLLRTLKIRKINRFNVWRVEDGELPDRFPVFLRTQSAHRGPISDLLGSTEEVAGAVDQALREGFPRKELMLVEYCAEPFRDNLFRKLAEFRIGELMVPSLCVHENRWSVNQGALGIADQVAYDDEYEIARTNRYGEAIRGAFEAGEIQYGRADFGLVGGQPQIYEINTNPHVARVTKHPFPIRIEAEKLIHDRLIEAFQSIDSAPGGCNIRIDGHPLVRRRKSRYLPWKNLCP